MFILSFNVDFSVSEMIIYLLRIFHINRLKMADEPKQNKRRWLVDHKLRHLCFGSSWLFHVVILALSVASTIFDIEALTLVVISYKIYETSLRRVS